MSISLSSVDIYLLNMNEKIYDYGKEMVNLLQVREDLDMKIKDIVETHFCLIEEKNNLNDKLNILNRQLAVAIHKIEELNKLNDLNSLDLKKIEEE